MLKAATCAADITPKCAVHLCGYAGEVRKHTVRGIHDHPLTVSLLPEIDGIRLLLISIDVITLGEERAAVIKDKIRKILAIENDHVIINAIHAHSGANGLDDMTMFGTPGNPEYPAHVCRQVIDSVQHLEQRLCEVQAYVTTGKVHGYYSRRTGKHLPFEDHVAIITLIHGDMVVVAMCNFNCYATVLGVENMLVSSDLVGKVRSLVREDLGVIPYTFTGASGDISNRQYRQGNDSAELDRVGNGVARILCNMGPHKKLGLHHVQTVSCDHTVSYDDTWYLREYQGGIRDAEEVLPHRNISLGEWKLIISEKTLLEKKLQYEKVEFYVRGAALHFGDLMIFTFPRGLTSASGLRLRRKCKTRHFLLIGYTNDYQGYSMEARGYGKTYETEADNTPIGESERIVDEIGDLL